MIKRLIIMYNTFKNTKAFTLVELSIVIVIIGLLVGGVVAGSSLVNTAKLRSILTNFDKYKTAISTFRLQYNAIPGDFRNAKAYWTSCVDDGNGTCNGDGNGTLTGEEAYRIWQHLALDGLIPGSYTGSYTVYGQCDLGTNVPEESFSACFFPRSSLGIGIYRTPSVSRNHFHFRDAAGNAAIKTPDAYAMDLKADDGLADAGWIGAEDGPCVTALYNVPHSYDLSQTNAKCRMFFHW